MAQAQGRTFFTEIVGLRIYLALWVALVHGLQTAGIGKDASPILKLAMNADEAVAVFMIVSGFVITNLLVVKQEDYPRYIVRRFFRLFPAFALACVAGYALFDEWERIALAVPWASEPQGAAYAAKIGAMREQIDTNLVPHALAHLTMIHGLIPDHVLPYAPMTFLPAAWSISLEWQFYLLAPLIIGALRSPWQIGVMLALSLVGLLAYRSGAIGHYAVNATIAANMHFFLLGIVSRLAHDRLSALSFPPLVAALGVAFVGLTILEEPLALIVWGVFYSYSLWHRQAPVTGALFRLATQAKPFQVLGEASYSLYLIHRPLQIATVWLLMDAVPLTHGSVLAMQGLAIALALPVSIAIYFTVERWGIALGRKAAAAMPKAAIPAAPADLPGTAEPKAYSPSNP